MQQIERFIHVRNQLHDKPDHALSSGQLLLADLEDGQVKLSEHFFSVHQMLLVTD